MRPRRKDLISPPGRSTVELGLQGVTPAGEDIIGEIGTRGFPIGIPNRFPIGVPSNSLSTNRESVSLSQ